MNSWLWLANLLLLVPYVAAQDVTAAAPRDPCAAIAGQRWVLPSEARACLRSFPLDPQIKANTLEVVTKMLAFHTSTNYQIQAPAPYNRDVRHDLIADLKRIERTRYSSEFDFHRDLYQSFKAVNDGHCSVVNRCFDSLWVTYLPIPLSLLTESNGVQNVYIAPDAFKMASVEFADSIQFWQDSLPGRLKGKLESLSGARVLLINGRDPWVAVNANADVTGSYQAHATRQNSFFSSYRRGAASWEYIPGNFASMVHPITDSVELTVILPGENRSTTFRIPYRSRFGSASKAFTDGASLRANNCVATAATNGVDYYDGSSQRNRGTDEPSTLEVFQQQPRLGRGDRRMGLDVIIDGLPLLDIDLPEEKKPTLTPLAGSYNVAEFFVLKDGVTGVLALGSFSAPDFVQFGTRVIEGLQSLKAAGATRLIVDVSNNGGGYICVAHWLHRLIIGAKETTVPQAGLDSAIRVGPLAQAIADKVVNEGIDPDLNLFYNPLNWNNASNQAFPSEPGVDWLQARRTVINGRPDSFSTRFGQECQPFLFWPDAPEEGLFAPSNVLIVSNGRCASSCSLFSITMKKSEGVRTVVLGGRKGVRQSYCGTVGGQSTDFATIDSEIKTTKLKGHALAPPDFLTNSAQGITWRLAYGLTNKNQPEEWQEHFADANFPITKETVNNPVATWEALVNEFF